MSAQRANATRQVGFEKSVERVLAALEASDDAGEILLTVSHEYADADAILEHVGYLVKKRRDRTAEVLEQLDAVSANVRAHASCCALDVPLSPPWLRVRLSEQEHYAMFERQKEARKSLNRDALLYSTLKSHYFNMETKVKLKAADDEKRAAWQESAELKEDLAALTDASRRSDLRTEELKTQLANCEAVIHKLQTEAKEREQEAEQVEKALEALAEARSRRSARPLLESNLEDRKTAS